jgi:peptidoglycan/xylan/chitin deacetylase (PgdA/CDA1 family)
MNHAAMTSPITAIPVLTYHDINRTFRMGITRVTPDAFQQQMEWLSRHGYQSVLLSQVPEAPAGDKKLFSITFDDAYHHLEYTARPVLQRMGFKSTLVVIVGFVGKANRWEARLGGPVLKHMDYPTIQDWVRRGHQVACHGFTHRCLTGLSPQEMKHEISDAKTELEDRLGVEISVFVPAFGRINHHVAQVIAESGYRTICLNNPPKQACQ